MIELNLIYQPPRHWNIQRSIVPSILSTVSCFGHSNFFLTKHYDFSIHYPTFYLATKLNITWEQLVVCTGRIHCPTYKLFLQRAMPLNVKSYEYFDDRLCIIIGIISLDLFNLYFNTSVSSTRAVLCGIYRMFTAFNVVFLHISYLLCRNYLACHFSESQRIIENYFATGFISSGGEHCGCYIVTR